MIAMILISAALKVGVADVATAPADVEPASSRQRRNQSMITILVTVASLSAVGASLRWAVIPVRIAYRLGCQSERLCADWASASRPDGSHAGVFSLPGSAADPNDRAALLPGRRPPERLSDARCVPYLEDDGVPVIRAPGLAGHLRGTGERQGALTLKTLAH